MIKVIASDMDGTLLGDNHKVAPETVEAIREAQAAGIRFMIATGRSYNGAMEELKGLDLGCDFIVGSGAEIRNPKGEILKSIGFTYEVCNEVAKTDIMDHIGWFASEVRRKVYFVQTDQEISRTIKISVARKLTYDQSETLVFQSGDRQSRTAFYAYGRGKLQGIYGTFSQAVQAAYPVMGIVTDQDQQILWDRVNRSTIRTIRSPQEIAAVLTGNLSELSQAKTMTDGTVLIDARGCTLNQMLYFIP